MSTDETPKVADFGLAREMVENEYGVQRVRHVLYMCVVIIIM